MNSRNFWICILMLFPWSFDRAAADEEYRVVADESEIDVLVFRAGALGRLGHNHVITAHDVTGRVIVGDTAEASSFELSLPVRALAVDDPAARTRAGSAFAGKVDEGDRARTRRNMLGEKLLDAGRYPEVRLRSTGITGGFDAMIATLEIEIGSGRHVVELAVDAVLYDDRLVATGRATLPHGALGLTPFTAGFGTLRVADDLTFVYRIVAARAAAPGASRGQGALPVVQHDGIALPDRAAE